MQLIQAASLVPGLRAPLGLLTRRKPSQNEWEDILYGLPLACKIGHMDIGQCIVVRRKMVVAVECLEGTDATLPYQTVHILKELGVTVEKVVVKDKVKLLHRAIVTLRKEDGSVMEMQLTLFDALVVSLIAGVPFYVNAKFLEDPRSGFTKSVPNTKALLLRLMPLKGLEREMEDAIRREDYEYAELIKQEMATRNKEEEEDYEDLEDLEKKL